VRKLVTALFCDLVGSTEMGERLDPESFRHVQTRYYAEMRRAIERHGGRVPKTIGDAIVGTFGVPRLEENDAERAVAAALEMRERIAELNVELEREWGTRLRIRIGINTGEAVVEDGASTSQVDVVGDVMNVGARLESAAGPGEILLGHQTYALVRNTVEVVPVGPLALKGKSARVPAWRLVQITARHGRTQKFDSPLVGRTDELASLAECLSATRAAGSGRLVTIVGQAGAGKSRLLHEFVSALQGTVTVLHGQCLPYGEGITFWPITQVIRQACGIVRDDSAEETRKKIAARLPDDESRPVVCERIAGVLGLTDAAAVTSETFWAIRKLLEAVAHPRPLVVAVEDVHWAEHTLLDLVEDLATRPPEAPILLLCLARPDLLESRPVWEDELANANTVHVDALEPADSKLLLENLLGGRPVREAASRHLAEVAAGNPLFLEELVRTLVEERLLHKEGGGWVADADLETMSVPPTLRALLGARLDRLGPDDRCVIEAAAVVGKEFGRRAVAELVPADGRRKVRARLERLVDRGLLRSRSIEEYRFHHILIRDVAYESIPKRARAELHERHAVWLEARAGERLPEVEEIVGYHLEQSVQLREQLGPPNERTRRLRERGGRLLASSGRHAAGRGDLHGATKLLERALALLPDEAADTHAVRLDLGVSLLEAGRDEESDRELTRAIELASARRDQRVEAYARMERSGLRVDVDPDLGWESLRKEAEDAVTVFAAAGDELGLARAWRRLGLVDVVACRLAAAAEEFERARAAARQAKDAREEARASNMIFHCLVLGPTPVENAIARCEELVAESGRHRSVEAFGLAALANLQAMVSRFDAARRLLVRSDAIFDELGQTRRKVETAFRAADAELLADDPRAAHRTLARAYRTIAPTNQKGYLASLAAARAESLAVLGQYSRAERLTAVSRALAGADDVDSQVRWRQIRARICARRGDLETAAALAREAARLAAATDALNMRAGSLIELAGVLRLSRDSDARTRVVEASRLYIEKGNRVGQRRAEALLSDLDRAIAAAEQRSEVTV
jgi:predicted ATPase/class 3 adenylate cyclase